MFIKKRNFLFDNLKGFLIICVIIGNSIEYVDLTTVNPHYFLLVLYIFHMPLFAFISGYFNKKSSRSTQKKVTGILKIFIGAQIFYFILNRFILGDTDLKLQFFSPSWTMWYFISLMSWYIIADFIKDKKKWFVYSIIAALLIGFDPSVGGHVSISRTFFFLPIFIAGMSLNELTLDTLRKNRKIIGVFSLIILIVLYVLKDNTPLELFFEYDKYTSYFNSALYPLAMRMFHYLGAFTIGAFILSITPTKKTCLSIIGQYSIVMYVSHGAIIKLLYKYSLTRYNSLISTILSEILILTITIGLTILYTHVKKLDLKNKLLTKVNSF
ncbi:MAG: acyltransferase family protein [Clostridiaceae bacterium]|nr:acyltransferase family protein [Clostridiaceae bacterium]